MAMSKEERDMLAAQTKHLREQAILVTKAAQQLVKTIQQFIDAIEDPAPDEQLVRFNKIDSKYDSGS